MKTVRNVVGFALATATVAAGVFGVGSYAQDASSRVVQQGQSIFMKKCVACHTIGMGDGIGPDLKDVLDRRDRAWLERWIQDPGAMLDEGDPIALDLLRKFKNLRMPNQGLTPSEVEAVLAFLESGSGAGASMPVLGPLPPGGDPLVGKALFSGAKRFRGGGPACIACHSAAGIGALGGGAMGPDLTDVYMKYREALLIWPVGLPPMKALYEHAPLLPEEQAHLVSFFQQTIGQRTAQAMEKLLAISLGGALVLLALAQVVWRRRLRAVRRPMVEQAWAGRAEATGR